VCRLMARKTNGRSVRLMTDDEIQAWGSAYSISPLSVGEIIAISWMPSWKFVPVGVALEYMRACGIDLNDAKAMDKHSKYLKRRPSWSHLKKDPEWRSRWLKMLIVQKEHDEAA